MGAARQTRFARTAGEAEAPAWATLALRAGLRLSGADLVTGVENLLNTSYRNHLDPVRLQRPGRNLFVRLSRGF